MYTIAGRLVELCVGCADQRVERSAVAFEKAAVLFNLGAALSADAAAADLTTDAGCKRAARRYQVLYRLFTWQIM